MSNYFDRMTFSKVYHSKSENNTPLFNEMILSWNGIRPQTGKWVIWVSFFPGDWLKFAEWGPTNQRTFKSHAMIAESHQDIVITKKGHSSRYDIFIEGPEQSSLHKISVCLTNHDLYKLEIPKDLPDILLENFPCQSQMVLNHPRNKDLCSPTSLSCALQFLSGQERDPIALATAARDEGFDIYGNWSLNIAEAYHQTQIPCRVERLHDFTKIHEYLMKKTPVVVSVKGTLPGAPLPYANGHLLCVIGYEKQKVICVDPAFETPAATFVKYDIADFLQAWGERRNLAYVFPTTS